MPQVSRRDVVEATERIAGLVERTPLIEAEIGGHKLWLKCECLQTGGAFKLRGATNRLLQLSEDEKAKGVVAFSSGNHAQGVALAAKRLGIRAVIVMPADAPTIKVKGTRSHGAKIRFYDRRKESREAIAAELARDSGATIVPSFDDPAIVAGQGTVGIEILEQLREQGSGPPERIIIPAGGGGLASGIALACDQAHIVCVEPEAWDDLGRSLAQGHIVPVADDAPDTLCDALQTPRISPITFDVLQSRGAEAISVSDEEAMDAIRYVWDKHQMVVEPGGAVALAALLAGRVDPAPGTVVILSGGNVDPALHARIIGSA